MLKPEVMKPRSYLLELVAICAAVGALTFTAACGVESQTENPCGPKPVFPEFATFVERQDNGHFLIAVTSTAYGDILVYRDDVELWSDCMMNLAR